MSARIAASILLSLLAAGATYAAESTLLIENVTLVSPELPQPLGNRHVLVRDGRIAVVSDKPIPVPAGARRLDGSGKFLTPGLTDAHVHVSDAVGLTPNDPSLADLEKDFFETAAAQLSLFRRHADAGHGESPRARGRVRSVTAASRHPPMRRGAGGRRLSDHVARQGDPAQGLQRLDLRARERERASTAGRRERGGAHTRSRRGAHRRERCDLREDRVGRRLRRPDGLAHHERRHAAACARGRDEAQRAARGARECARHAAHGRGGQRRHHPARRLELERARQSAGHSARDRRAHAQHSRQEDRLSSHAARAARRLGL